MPTWTGTLSPRHRRLFLGLADLWRPSDPVGAAGGEAKSYGAEPALSAVPYLLRRKSAIDEPELIGLLESQDMMTVDVAVFPPGTVIGSSWIVVDRSLTVALLEGANYNGAWICRGEAVSKDDMDAIRRAGKVKAYVNRMPEAPDEIQAYYA